MDYENLSYKQILPPSRKIRYNDSLDLKNTPIFIIKQKRPSHQVKRSFYLSLLRIVLRVFFYSFHSAKLAESIKPSTADSTENSVAKSLVPTFK